MRVITIDIEGMYCGICASSVRDSLLSIGTITDVSVNLRTNQATLVTEETPLEEATLHAAVERVGYLMVPGSIAVAEALEDPRYPIPGPRRAQSGSKHSIK